MREVLPAVCLIGAVVVLQGCGGGGGGGSPTPAPHPGPAPGPAGKCKLPGIDLVTQSATATTSIDAKVNIGEIETTESGTITGMMKIDTKAWNVRIDQTGDITVDAGALIPKMDTKVEEKLIVDPAKKLVVEWIKVTNATSGAVLVQNCSAVTVAKMPTPAELDLAWGFAKGMLQKLATCGGNDGTDDTWKIKVAHTKDQPLPPPFNNMKVPPFDLNFNMDMTMGSDYVVHSMSTDVKMHVDKVNGTGPIEIQESTKTTSKDASTSGPTSDDLDYSSWGTCTPIPHDGALSELDAFSFRRNDNKLRTLLVALFQASEQQSKELVI